MAETDVRNYNDIYKAFSKNPEEFIAKCEKGFDDFLEKCVEKVKKEKNKRIFICGQSGSGKTTTALRLAELLEKNGFKTHIIELDDFFLSREKQKKNKSGSEDFESIFSLDLESLYKFGRNLREGKPVIMPEFDFKRGGHAEEKELIIGREDIIIVEGLHSFNERILKTFGENGEESENLKIYVTLASSLDLNGSRLTKTDLRFVRRLIRDYYHRNAGPEWTIELWHRVRAGEKRYVSGYMSRADVFFNTFLEYEIFQHKDDFVFLAERGAKNAVSRGYYKMLLNKFKKIDVPHSVKIPSRSILNEFTK